MEKEPQNKLSPAGWLTLAILSGLFGAALWYAVKVWNAMSGVHMSGWAGHF